MKAAINDPAEVKADLEEREGVVRAVNDIKHAHLPQKTTSVALVDELIFTVKPKPAEKLKPAGFRQGKKRLKRQGKTRKEHYEQSKDNHKAHVKAVGNLSRSLTNFRKNVNAAKRGCVPVFFCFISTHTAGEGIKVDFMQSKLALQFIASKGLSQEYGVFCNHYNAQRKEELATVYAR
jgi:hypothetical protein